jgi:lipopolysaccharide transport system permease protein
MSSALFHMGINILVLLFMWLLFHGSLQWTFLLFPLVNLPLVLFCIGLMWFLASLGVYLRDIIQSITIVTTSLLFLSPVFYSIDMIPEPYRTIVSLNPLTFIIECNRNVLIYGIMPNWISLLMSLIISFLVAGLGYLWFQKTRKGFADVL